jgi:hypothetical protein
MSIYNVKMTPQARNFRAHHSGAKFDEQVVEASDLAQFWDKVRLISNHSQVFDIALPLIKREVIFEHAP